jgi:hypothetical protein
MFMGKCIVSISNKMKRYTVYLYLETALHVSGGTSTHHQEGAYTTVSTPSGIFHTVTAICRYRERVGTGLSVLWVAYATHSTLVATFPGTVLFPLLCSLLPFFSHNTLILFFI